MWWGRIDSLRWTKKSIFSSCSLYWTKSKIFDFVQCVFICLLFQRMIIFHKQNFLYDNGIINFLLILREIYGDGKWFDYEMDGDSYVFVLKTNEYNMQMRLTHTSLIVEKWGEEEVKGLMVKVFAYSLWENVIFTDNVRYYRDIKQETIIAWKKVTVEGEDKNTILNAYVYKKYDQIPYKWRFLTDEDIQEHIDQIWIERLKVKKIDKTEKWFDYMYSWTYGVYIHSTLEEHKEKFASFKLSLEKKVQELDSKTHPFEDGQWYFKDNLKTKKDEITFFDNAFYQIGSKSWKILIKPDKDTWFHYYFHTESFIHCLRVRLFLSSFIAKKRIESYTITVWWEEKIIHHRWNIDFYKNMGDHFWYAQSQSDYELRILYFCYQLITKLEEKDKKAIQSDFEKIFIYSYKDDGVFRCHLEQYQKVSRLFRFFQSLHASVKHKELDWKIESITLLDTLFRSWWILHTISCVKPDWSSSLLLHKATQHILFFISLRSLYMTTQETLFKEKRSLPEWLKDFQDLYLQELWKNDERYLHNLCFTVGTEIGRFLGSIDEERAIFGLRNIKNHKQLVWRINDFAFLLLKKSSEWWIANETKELITILLDSLNKDNWEIVKDYLGIYIIQKYQSVQYAKSSKGN